MNLQSSATMANTHIPDVCDTYFQQKSLTIARSVCDQLKANASSFPSVLVGCIYGHLGLILTAAQYATLSYIRFVCPVNPGPFNLPDKGTYARHHIWKDAITYSIYAQQLKGSHLSSGFSH